MISVNCLGPNSRRALLSTKLTLAAAMILSLLIGCDSNGDAQRLSNLVNVSDANYSAVALQGGSNIIGVGEVINYSVLARTDAAGTAVVEVSGAFYNSSDTAVATVTNNGIVTGVADGTVTITADYGGLFASETLRVSSAALSAINITTAADNFQINECSELQLRASGVYMGEESEPRDITNAVIWAVSPTADLFNLPRGLLRSESAGVFTVSASQGSITGRQEVEVLNNLVAIDIVAEEGELSAGNPLQFEAIPVYDNVDGVVPNITDSADWTLEDQGTSDDFASVDNTLPDKGLVTQSRFGRGTLNVRCGGQSEFIEIASGGGAPIDQVAIAGESPLTITFGGTEGTRQLRVNALVSGRIVGDVTDDVEWTVVTNTNETQLTLSDSGLLTYRGAGEITVTATYVDESNNNETFVSTDFKVVVQ